MNILFYWIINLMVKKWGLQILKNIRRKSIEIIWGLQLIKNIFIKFVRNICGDHKKYK